MKYSAYALLALSAALLAGCTSYKVKSKADADFDWASVSAYEWIQAPEKILDEDDTYISKNMQIALNNELTRRGWQQVLATERADIQVMYYIKLSEHQEYAGPDRQNDEARLTGGFTYSSDKGGWASTDRQSDLSVYTIETGTLYLLINDVRTKKNVWTGTIETRFDRSASLAKRKETLEAVSRKIVSRIP